MKSYLFILIFILLSLNVSSYWQTYQNDLRNIGSANGTGYFPLSTANFSDDSLGMDFQPLADDIDRDGKNEIAILSNSSLIIFSPRMDILAQAKTGGRLGQPALFDFDNDGLIEIIFNARQDSTDYFFAYQYNNSDLRQEFNITLPNEANFSGIKCLNLNGTNSCVFKDKRNYVHIVDMNSKTDSSYNTSVYDETRHTVPAIGDIDNDGSMDAVFWFNEDNRSGYGFLAFDLGRRKVKWTVDNIFSPIIIIPGIEFHELFKLKGQPVLVDMNNDHKLEIAASVFYDDDFLSEDNNDDWYTELFVYNSSGSKLFSRCEIGASLCNDGVGGNKAKWEGTNPFVLDANNDGVDDICFIKDSKFNVPISDNIDCYNYSGDLLLDSKLSTRTENVRTAIAADMNNDGKKEVITENDIFTLDGTSIFTHGFGSGFVIPSDLDGNKGLDLLWTSGINTKVFLDSNNYTLDLSVSSHDITFSKSDNTHVNVTAMIKNTGQVGVDNVKAIMYNAGTLENKTSILSIRRNGNATFSAVLGLKEGEKVLVSVDYENEINETNEENNLAIREFNGFPHVFVNVDLLEPVNIQDEFREYIKNKLTSGYYTTNENEADVLVYIGKNNPGNIDNNIKTLNDFEFGYDYGDIIYNDNTGGLPYNGLIGAFKDLNGKTIVMLAGNEIEGNIAAAKEFINNQALFLNVQDKNSVFVDDENADAVRVYDFLHLGGNNEHYEANDDEFRKIVRNALNDEMFNVEDKTVAANGITLRLRNLKPNISNDYLEYLNSTGMPVEMPVVLSRGIHSNLTSWENLGSELANDGRDLWLIEITGGPGQDCDTCPNYNFSDLTDVYWPTLINGVLNFTGKDKIQYVGHSNGGRIAIVSLADGKIDPNKIDTLIGVAIPSAFEGYSTFGNYFGKYGEQIMNELSGKGHVSLTEIGEKLRRLCLSNFEVRCGILTLGLKSDNKMSFNVDKQYYLWINDTTDVQIGKNLPLGNFYLIEGWVFDEQSTNITHDFIVTGQDEQAIYNNVDSSNKKLYKVWGAHTAGWTSASLPDRDFTKSIIKDALNKKLLNKYKSNEISSS